MTNKQYRLVVFDWEGTLSDNLGLILHSIAMEAKRLNYGDLNETLARQMVEYGLVNALKKIFPHLNSEEYERLLSSVQQALLTKHGETFLIPGALDMMIQLKNAGYFIAIASNKGPQSLQRAIHTTGMDQYIDTYRAAGPLPPKPDKAMLDDILAFFSLSADETIMIGDSVTDMQMAANAEVDALGIDLYHSQAPFLKVAGAIDVFDNYQLLTDYLLTHKKEESV